MSTAATPALLGPDFARRYGLGPMLRSTPFTQVWAAHDHELDRDVTMTIAHERLGGDPVALRIAASSVGLDHPNIAAVYEAGTFVQAGHPLPWVVGEPVSGPNVDQFPRPAGLTDDRWAVEVLDIAGQVAAALRHAHAHGVVHGNLGPATVLLTGSRPVVKVVDFGPQPSDPGVTRAMWERFTRSVEYPSPEQVKGAVPTVLSDVFGFGCVLAVLLLDTSGVSLAGELRRIAKRAMKKHPSDRWPSFDAVEEQLRGLRGDSVGL